MVHEMTAPQSQGPEAQLSPLTIQETLSSSLTIEDRRAQENAVEGDQSSSPVDQDSTALQDVQEERAENDEVEEDDNELRAFRQIQDTTQRKLDGFLVLGNTWNIVTIGKFS